MRGVTVADSIATVYEVFPLKFEKIMEETLTSLSDYKG